MKIIFIFLVALVLPLSAIANEKVIEREGLFYDLETKNGNFKMYYYYYYLVLPLLPLQ